MSEPKTAEATETTENTEPTTARVITGKLHRVRVCRAKRFAEAPLPPPPDAVRRPARVAVMLALAHKIEDAIQRGVARDRAEVARRLGLSRARVTQLVDLTLLEPKLQLVVLTCESVDGVEPMSERHLRRVARKASWEAQRTLWAEVQTSPDKCG